MGTAFGPQKPWAGKGKQLKREKSGGDRVHGEELGRQKAGTGFTVVPRLASKNKLGE